MPESRPTGLLLRRFRSALEGFELQGCPVIAATSGGADSMAMLELLGRSAGRLRTSVHAVYVDHGLREGTDAEARLVATAAEAHGFSFEVCKLAPAGPSDENHLRSQRYAALEAAAKAFDARAILTAHTRDDQIETIVFRLFRGAGRRGMAGMPARRGLICRPLLGVDRDELHRFAAEAGLVWLEDPTNTDEGYRRNLIRHRVLPLIAEAFGAGALRRLTENADRWRQEEDYLDAEAKRYFAGVVSPSGVLDVVAYGAVPAALAVRVLRHWLVACGATRTVEIRHVAAVEALITSELRSGSVDLPGLRVGRSGDQLRAERVPSGLAQEPRRNYIEGEAKVR